MEKKTEGEIFWEKVDGFMAQGYTQSAAIKAVHTIESGKKPQPPRYNKEQTKRELPQGFREYLRPFISMPYDEEQREIDIDAIIQFLEEAP